MHVMVLQTATAGMTLYEILASRISVATLRPKTGTLCTLRPIAVAALVVKWKADKKGRKENHRVKGSLTSVIQVGSWIVFACMGGVSQIGLPATGGSMLHESRPCFSPWESVWTG